MQAPIHTPDESATALGAFFCLLWLVILVWWLVAKSRVVAETVAWFRRKAVPAKIFIVCAFCAVLTYGSIKSGGNEPQGLPRPPLLLQVLELSPEPATAPVSVWTNGVALRAESTNAVEVTAFRTVGGTELGDWIEVAEPFFAIGSNPVSRCYVSASGSVSFETMRRPPVGSALPDGTGLPVLCPLRAPLGMVPEANWTNANAQSRFWHDALPGGGRVLTWENALVDRLPGRRVSLQVEMRSSGDSVFRYSFQDELDPPATNFVMGAQFGTNGVNALSVLGTNLLATTVWNVEGEPVTNGVSVADLLCTNGVLRTPATFELRWRNTTGLDPEADTDNDGLTDWAETFLWGTDPNYADTDGDGIADNVELMTGTDPFDADEDGDGVPDGTSAADWAANTLWAANATNTARSITITLNSAVPAGASASLMVGGLCIPLRSPSSWTLGLVPGELYPYRLVVGGDSPVDLSIGPGETTPPMRGNMDAMSIALWLDGMGGTFDGWSLGGSGNMAIPALNVQWVDPGDGSHEESGVGVCLHGGTEAVFTPTLHPEAVHDRWQLNDLTERNGNLVLSVPDAGIVYYGSATLFSSKIRFGVLVATVSAHRCDSSYNSPYCSVCGHYQPDDFTLSARTPLTLKHDNQTTIGLSHPNSPETTIENTTIEIRRKTSGGGSWLTLGAESSLNPWTAKIAGTFELRGRGTADGREVFTPIAEVVVQFPCYDQITNDASVITMTHVAWTNTLADCSPTNSRERGFWIYLNTLTDSYEAGNLHLGDSGAVELPARPSDQTEPISATDAGARYPVASFHTHTPTVYWWIGERTVGPSVADNHLDDRDQVPGLVFDYVEDRPDSREIKWGHPLHAPAMIYKSLGVERRPTP